MGLFLRILTRELTGVGVMCYNIKSITAAVTE